MAKKHGNGFSDWFVRTDEKCVCGGIFEIVTSDIARCCRCGELLPRAEARRLFKRYDTGHRYVTESRADLYRLQTHQLVIHAS